MKTTNKIRFFKKELKMVSENHIKDKKYFLFLQKQLANLESIKKGPEDIDNNICTECDINNKKLEISFVAKRIHFSSAHITYLHNKILQLKDEPLLKIKDYSNFNSVFLKLNFITSILSG